MQLNAEGIGVFLISHHSHDVLSDRTPYDLIFVFDTIGYNFAPSEIGGAYGLVQLDKLDEFNGRRRANRQGHDYHAGLREDGLA